MINKKYLYSAKECPNCGGWGSYTEVIRTIEEKFLRRPKIFICKKCDGTGEEEKKEQEKK